MLITALWAVALCDYAATASISEATNEKSVTDTHVSVDSRKKQSC